MVLHFSLLLDIILAEYPPDVIISKASMRKIFSSSETASPMNLVKSWLVLLEASSTAISAFFIILESVSNVNYLVYFTSDNIMQEANKRTSLEMSYTSGCINGFPEIEELRMLPAIMDGFPCLLHSPMISFWNFGRASMPAPANLLLSTTTP